MAEISVPAWPMPIHQTKFVIANPHATGTLTPQMPMPRYSSMVTASASSPRSASPSMKPKSHPRPVRCVRTMPAILSVTDV